MPLLLVKLLLLGCHPSCAIAPFAGDAHIPFVCPLACDAPLAGDCPSARLSEAPRQGRGNYCEGVGRADKGVSFRRLTNMKRAIQEEEIGVSTLGRQYIHAQLTPSVSLHQGEKGRRESVPVCEHLQLILQADLKGLMDWIGLE